MDAKKMLFCSVPGSCSTLTPPPSCPPSLPLSSQATKSRSLQTLFAWVICSPWTSMGELGGSACEATGKRDSPPVQRMSQKYPAVPTACQGLQVWEARTASLTTSSGAAVLSVFSIIEKHYSYCPFHSRGLPKHLVVGIILHLYWNTAPSGAEHCSCLTAHSNITQADGKENEMCKKCSFHFPYNSSFLSSLSAAICANSRQLQMCVFPTSICRDLALETGICLPTYCLWVQSAPRVKFPLPHSSLAVLPDMLQDGGQTRW